MVTVRNTQLLLYPTWVFRASGRLYPTLELELGIGDLGIHDVGYRRSWVFRTQSQKMTMVVLTSTIIIISNFMF